ncbi:MAG: nucleotidyltransferase family protein [Gammaproteobacteria bacterium]|nr:nucleotidyltransferase family protein [Gammaproteobacteria bacterium]
MTEQTPTRSPSTTPVIGNETGVLLLAAGFSRRFGDIKLQARLRNGSSVFEQTLARIASATPRILVVTRADLAEVTLATRRIAQGLGMDRRGERHHIDIVQCPDAHLGMGHTLAFGMAHLPDWEGCLVCLGDMPFIATATYAQMLAALHHDTILLPQYEGETGNPVGFGCDFFPALRAMQGDTGGRDVVRANRERVQLLTVSDAAILQDIDTPEDLARLEGI